MAGVGTLSGGEPRWFWMMARVAALIFEDDGGEPTGRVLGERGPSPKTVGP